MLGSRPLLFRLRMVRLENDSQDRLQFTPPLIRPDANNHRLHRQVSGQEQVLIVLKHDVMLNLGQVKVHAENCAVRELERTVGHLHFNLLGLLMVKVGVFKFGFWISSLILANVEFYSVIIKQFLTQIIV